MELPPALGIIAVVVLVLANGFFVATEFAIVAVRRSRLEQLAAEGNKNALVTQRVVEHLDTYIAACQLGITIASLALGWVGEPALAHLLEPPLEALVGRFAPAAAHGVAIGTTFAIITALHIVIGELAPKGLALQRPEATSLWVARPMVLFELIFRWPIAVLNGIGNGVLKIFGLEPATGHEMVHTVAELRLLVTGSREAGEVEESEARIASRAFTFADLTAGALMTPRTEVDAIPVDISVEQLMARLAKNWHTRLPVYEGSLDNIVGILYVPDFYRALYQATPERPFDLRSVLRAHMTVPGSKPADDVLEEMRASGRYFAVVIDEYGGTAGILTLEDLVEALVGPLGEEVTTETAPTVPLMAQAADGSMFLDGLTRLEEWEEIGNFHLDPADHEAVETIGGLVMSHLGRMPEVGDEITVAGRTLRVEEMDGLRVALVRVLPATEPPRNAPSGEEARTH